MERGRRWSVGGYRSYRVPGGVTLELSCEGRIEVSWVMWGGVWQREELV